MLESSVGQRFSQLIQQLGMSKNAFAISLDKTATVIQHLVDERNKPGFDLMRKVFEVYPNVSKDWLLMGEGPMLLTSEPIPVVADVPVPGPSAASVTPRVAPVPPSFPEALFPVSAARQTIAAPPPALVESPTSSQSAAANAPPATPNEPVVASAIAAASPQSLPPVLPSAVPATVPGPPAAPDAAYLTAALHAQYLQHQLALAEQRNQHLLAQQQLMQQQQALMQQMLDVMRRPV